MVVRPLTALKPNLVARRVTSARAVNLFGLVTTAQKGSFQTTLAVTAGFFAPRSSELPHYWKNLNRRLPCALSRRHQASPLGADL